MALLEAFSGDGRALELKDLAARTGLYKSTILRLAATLTDAGMLQRDIEGRFRLGPKLAQLGLSYQRGLGMTERIRSALRRLVAETGESASFYVRSGDSRLCLMRENSTQSVRHHLEEGSILPLEIGAAGRLLLAFGGAPGKAMQRIREQRIAESVGERDPLVAAVAAPVCDVSGACIGALAVSGLVARMTPSRRRTYARLTATLAAELSRPG
ncbi:MAG: IclR family transcriptional regulator [Burkholderiaceae bacterium]|nr:IclR family transcriptional regulator [Burkholderiaceae bacterium]